MADDALTREPIGAGRSDRMHMEDLPQPHVARSRWPGFLIWLVPLLALATTLYYANVIAKDHGPELIVTVDDANAIQADKTLVRCHGVQIGKVVDVTLAGDHGGAKVHIRLRRDAAAFAKQGTQIWLVEPDFSGSQPVGLNTMFRGPYFEAIAGDGPSIQELTALPRPPVTADKGFRLALLADNRSHLSPGTPIMYRGFDVGAVVSSTLSANAKHVTVIINVETRYAPLIRRNSVFWIVAPAEIKGGLFSGVELKVDSLKSIFTGGIAFATPDKPLAEPAFENGAFPLETEMPKDADKWRPDIPIEPVVDEGRRFPGGEPEMLESESKMK